MNYPRICSLIGELKLISRYLGSWARSILEIKFLSPAKITAEIRPGSESEEKN